MSNHLADTLGFALDFGDPAFELQLGVQLDQLVAIQRLEVQVVQAHIQRYIDLDRGQLVGKEGHFSVFFELGRQVFSTTNRQGRHNIELFVQVGQTTTDAHQQARGRLRANAWNARDVVRRVAHQREVIDDLLGRDAEFLFHPLNVHHAAGHGVDQGDVGIDQLRHVLVAGRDHHRAVCCSAAAGQCANHIIGFNAFDAQQRKALGDDAGVQRLDLNPHVIGHARAIGLVFGVHVVAKRPALGIENHRKRAVRILLAQAFQHVQHALHSACRQALGGSQRRQRMEGAVQI